MRHLASWLGKRTLGLALVALAAGLSTSLNAKPRSDKPALLFHIETRKRAKHEPVAWLQYGVSVGVKAVSDNNLSRDDGLRDSKRDVGGHVETWARAQIASPVVAFGHVQYGARWIDTHKSSYPVRSDFRVKEALVSIATGAQTQLTFGRMRFSDPAKWIADGAVDGVHFSKVADASSWEVAAFRGTKYSRPSYAMAHKTWTTDTWRYSILAMAEADGGDRRYYLFGHLAGSPSEQHRFEINSAIVLGDAANQKSNGFGFDLRGIRKLNGDLNSQVTYGLAFGTSGFRQTGLQTNKTYDGGQKQFNRYGYAYRPELSNLAIATLALGIRPSRKFSVDAGLHAYAQLQPSTTAPSARIDGQTTGNSRFVGTEISLVGAWRPSKKTKFQFGIGVFKPGSAYVDRSTYSHVYTQLSIYF